MNDNIGILKDLV